MIAFVGSAADRFLSLPFRLGASFNRVFDRGNTIAALSRKFY
jgi:hypothetical protein